ncbi:MAG: DNA (cytosine-5-)-methyltransferase [Actinomycetota bacterium]|nr:DNA (cytosine-5-)-methyltransferase [Actinomycetota bacterium]
MNERTHASFFSGVGGLDMGLERAGWRTVSFSEIDPYASAVLTERWPGVPNLGDITNVADQCRRVDGEAAARLPDGDCAVGGHDRGIRLSTGRDVGGATLWTGGFPCQDLSVAGKRRGMGVGTRSGLAYAFLDLVGRHHPRFVLLENVPGLLSSHGGRDMAALVGALVELGYGVGYRVLDARHFGVPQRRRRVFILGVSPGGRAGAERAAEVLSVGSRCRRHPPTGIEAGPGVAAGVGVSTSHALTSSRTRSGRYDANGETFAITAKGPNNGRDMERDASLILGSSPDPHGMRAADGLAGRSHDRDGLADTLRVGGRASGAGDSYDNTPWVAETAATLLSPNGGSRTTDLSNELVAFNPYRTLERDGSVTSGYAERDVVDALHGPTGNKEPLFVSGRKKAGNAREAEEADVVNREPDLLPLGLDSHRYRCCGNGVVSDVAEWIGLRLRAVA